MTLAIFSIPGGLLILYLLMLLVRQPHLRRMGWRNIRAHGMTSVLTAAGLAVSTALITMTLSVNASMEASSARMIERHFGPVTHDMPASYQNRLSGSVFMDADIRRMQDELKAGNRDTLPVVSYVMTMIRTDAAGNPMLIAPDLYMYGFNRDEALRFDPKAADAASELAAGEAILSEQAAGQLDARAGDTVIAIDSEGREVPLYVRKVMQENGLSGYRGIEMASGTVIVHMDTARGLAGSPAGGYTNVLAKLDGKNQWPSVPVRDNLVRSMEDATSFITLLFTMTSMVAVIIGIILITNIYKMIAEERRQEMGILRAVGLGRRELIRLLQIEGLLYGIGSGIIGTAAGLGLGRILMVTVKKSISHLAAEAAPFAAFIIDPGALAAGFSIGLAIVFVCVWIIARRSTGRSIIESLRPLDDALLVAKRRPLLALWVTVTAIAVTAALIMMTAVPGIRAAWLTEERIPFVFMLAMLFIPFSIWLFVRLLGVIRAALLMITRRSARAAMAIRLALGNLTAERTRTMLLLMMFAVVSCFISIPVIYQDVMEQAIEHDDPTAAVGGYDYIARDPRKLTIDQLASVSSVNGGEGFRMTVVQQHFLYSGEGPYGSFSYMANGIDRVFADSNDLPLVRRDSNYGSDRQAWQTLASDPNTVILGEDWYNSNGRTAKLGELYELKVGGRTMEKRVIGIASVSGYHPEAYGIWLSQEALNGLADGDHKFVSTVFVGLDHRDRALELELKKALTLQNVTPVTDVVEASSAYYLLMRNMFGLFLHFNQLALIIGIAGLLVVLYRLIRQRRQQLGMLRAVGVSRKDVYAAVLVEGLFIGIAGIMIGFTFGVYMAYTIFEAFMMQDFGWPLRLPAGKLLLCFAGAGAAAAAAACLPAWRALRIAPVEATRYVN